MTDRELMQQALEALDNSVDQMRYAYETDWRHGMPTRKAQLDRMKQELDAHEAAITALKERLAQPEQEPVAWRWRDVDGLETIQSVKPYHEAEPLYTTPPQRKPLTDEEIWALHDGYLNPVDFARAIEAAHGIKGQA